MSTTFRPVFYGPCSRTDVTCVASETSFSSSTIKLQSKLNYATINHSWSHEQFIQYRCRLYTGVDLGETVIGTPLYRLFPRESELRDATSKIHFLGKSRVVIGALDRGKFMVGKQTQIYMSSGFYCEMGYSFRTMCRLLNLG